MNDDAGETVGDMGTVRSAGVPARIEHEVVDDELAAVLEKIGQRFLALRPDEDVRLRDFLPRQLTALSSEIILALREFFFFLQQRDSRLQPLVAGNHGMKKAVSCELVAIRGKWQKERTRLYDRETGLPIDETLHQQVTVGVVVAGQRVDVMPVLDISAAVTPDSINSTAKLADTASSKLLHLEIVTAVLAALGVLLLVIAAVRRRPATASQPQDNPPPARVPTGTAS